LQKRQAGKVVEVTASGATVELQDGTRELVEIPQMDKISIEVGMSVTVIDTGDGKPIYMWGLE
jgi:predicted RNA-binding protein with RPS1 domain